VTPNLKVDYLRLPQLDGQHLGKAKRRPAETASEKYVADLWSELIGVDDISATDNFIEIGGHSLLTIRVIARIAAETGIEMGPQDLLSRTLAGVAALLDANGGIGKSGDLQESVSRTSRLLGLLGFGRRPS
jgi:acyl carrier protein